MIARTNLKLLRDNRGLSVRKLAELSGVNKDTINQAENGKRLLSDTEIESICSALGVTVDLIYPDPTLRKVLAE